MGGIFSVSSIIYGDGRTGDGRTGDGRTGEGRTGEEKNGDGRYRDEKAVTKNFGQL